MLGCTKQGKRRHGGIMSFKIQVIFYSMYGHIYKMAEATAAGAREIKDANVEIIRVPELMPEEILIKSGAKEAQKSFEHIPVLKIDEINADAYIFGTPTRFGNMCAQMRNFLDQLSSLWLKNAFVGKIGSVFTSVSNQHSEQENTIANFHTALLHLGMLITGAPYSEKQLSNEIISNTPHGATFAGKRLPSENELAIARYQGRHVAEITRDLVYGRRK